MHQGGGERGALHRGDQLQTGRQESQVHHLPRPQPPLLPVQGGHQVSPRQFQHQHDEDDDDDDEDDDYDYDYEDVDNDYDDYDDDYDDDDDFDVDGNYGDDDNEDVDDVDNNDDGDHDDAGTNSSPGPPADPHPPCPGGTGAGVCQEEARKMRDRASVLQRGRWQPHLRDTPRPPSS